ncbi:MAG: hypothetical protein GF307_03870 [candidate division Zixibacteria bacterium]|nr:hypothetical protein [candidate division Zixibacteria bacterium]
MRKNKFKHFRLSILLTATFIPIILGGCASSGHFHIPPPIPDDRRDIPEPEYRDYNLLADGFEQSFTRQGKQAFDFARQLRFLTGNPKQAFNFNAFGEVNNSSWFTNRNAFKQLSTAEIKRGPNTLSGPDTSGAWLITRAKTEGVTPGFTIKDPRGDKYVIKFDPPGYPEMATGAEVISTKLFYACGYNTPENYITVFDPRKLKIDDDVEFTDEDGEERLMTDEDLRKVLSKVQHRPDGKLRALASKYIKGIPKGPFHYLDTRDDDPNDFIPHEHRRELRGLHVICAWLSHFDTKAGNSFDSYATENGKSYIKHYLMDFGSTLGSAAHSPQAPYIPFVYDVDFDITFANLVTLGLYVRPWEKLDGVKYPSIGLYESSLFKPHEYRPNTPNPAFENMTDLDGYWAAKIVMSFTDRQIRAAVTTAQYSNPEAEAYLIKTIIERRNIVGRHWFKKINPLDKFRLEENADGEFSLAFVDLGIHVALWSTEGTEYRYEFRRDNKILAGPVETGYTNAIPLSAIPEKYLYPADPATGDYIETRIYVKRDGWDKWSKWVKVWLDSYGSGAGFTIVGVSREE